MRLAVCLLAVVVVVVAEASAHRLGRRVTRSCSPNCVLLTSCPELYGLLKKPSLQNMRRLQRLTCGFQNMRAKVCCPGPPPPPRTPPPPPPPPTPPPPTQPPTPTPFRRSPVSPGQDLLPESCGSSLGGNKIWGGKVAGLGVYPWMAVLGFSLKDSLISSTSWGCGGSLINRRYVLTAAHCTVPAMTRSMNLTTVRLGENNLETSPDCAKIGTHTVCGPMHQDFQPQQVTRHPNFNSEGTMNDDIALIRLDRDVDISGLFIAPVCLPPPGVGLSELVGNRFVTVTGWGDTESGGRSQQLLQLKLPMVPLPTCRAVANYDTILLRRAGQACFGGEHRRDACFKDSGGPAVITMNADNTPPFVQVGVVSFGTTNCAVEGVPGVYTDVTHYRRWILDNLKP